MHPTILLVDPSRRASALRERLAAPGRQVRRLDDVAALSAEPPAPGPLAVLVLDAGDVAPARRLAPMTPLALVVTHIDDDERVAAYEEGADDYLAAGCSDRELEARTRALLRRAGRGSAPQPVAASRAAREARTLLTCGPVTLDPLTREATLGGEPLRLTAREFDLLAYLVARPGHVVTRQRLLRDVWGGSGQGSGRTVDVHVAQVRAKLGDHARLVHTIRGVGYSSRSAIPST